MHPFQAKLQFRPGAQPKFQATCVPFANKPAIEKELQQLEATGIITKIAHSHWADAPLMMTKMAKSFFKLLT